MSDTHTSGDAVVENDRHNPHDHHTEAVPAASRDSGDVGDGDSAILNLANGDVSTGSAPSTDSTENPVGYLEAAMVRLKDDVGVLAEGPVITAFSILHATDMPGYLRLRQRAKGVNKDASITLLDKLVRQSLPGGGDDPSIIDELVALGREHCQLVHDADRNAVAIIPMDDRREVWRVYSPGFENWLRAAYWQAKQAGVTETTLKAALATLAAAGIHDGEQVEVYLRVAREGESYYIDLCDETWRVVYITPSGWRVLNRSPVLFTRTSAMRALPMPNNADANIERFWQHVNVPPARRILLLAWILECFRPDTPFPVLELVGEQGSAKSTTQTVLRSLIDPNKVSLRGRPKTTEDVFVAAGCNWLVSYENLSSLTPEQQDAFCTLATGGGYAGRQLYTNGEEHVMETKRPVVLNGIAVVATRPDLIDRVIHIDMPVIAPEQRKDDADATTGWERDRAMVFAALLDLFAATLARLPSIRLTRKQRMADFERLGEAVARTYGYDAGEFQAQYAEMVSAGVDRALESNPVAQALEEFLLSVSLPWQGTTASLFERLITYGHHDRSSWPRSPKGLSDQLRRMAPAFRTKGIEINHVGHTRQGGQWRISAISK